MAHVSDKKKKIVDDFVKLFKEYDIVAAVNMENLPAPQLQTMRELLRDKVILRMTKRRLIKIAIEKVKDKKKDIEKLLEHIKTGMPALLFTKENPFTLYKTIEKNKSPAPAKAGQVAPKDIVINAGPTPFMPGPVIGELGAIGVKTGVENGKVAVKSDTVVCKAGEEIKPNVAAMLTRLDINPMEIGLDIPAIYEDGVIYTRDILAIDETKYINDITDAARWAFNLSIEAGYPTSDNMAVLVTKAYNDSRSLALETGFLADGVVEQVLARAHNQMLSIKNLAKLEE